MSKSSVARFFEPVLEKIEDLRLSESWYILIPRRAMFYIGASAYYLWIINFFHYLPARQNWMIMVIAGIGLVFGLGTLRIREFRPTVSEYNRGVRNTYIPVGFWEQKLYQLCLLHVLTAVTLWAIQRVPAVEKFFQKVIDFL
jgi:hypothetical protein